jgi:urea carboxylase
MFRSVLIANRGEIAARIIRTLKRLGVASVGVASDADRFTLPMRMADRVIRLGAGNVAETYLDIDKIIAAVKESGAEAVHPGYGFLSENIAFAERLAGEGIAFIGPSPDSISAFGLKHTARDLAAKCGVPLLPGSGILANAEEALQEAARIGYPVMLKSTAGGGGIGMQLCRDADELAQRFASVARMASGNFGDARLYIERFVARARHIEVQIFGDGKGNVLTLGERDCSLQRRNQKVVEEAPAPNLSDDLRETLRRSAVALGQAVNYASAGTVEFVYDVERSEAYFLEVNTRLQVEHPVTEKIFGIDLVEWMVRQASGEFALPDQAALKPKGASIEVRLYAENPARDFRPATGIVTALTWPKEARIETWVETGTEVSPFYDPMLAKIIVKGDTREQALKAMSGALADAELWGVETNLAYLREVIESPAFQKGEAITATLKDISFQPRTIDVLSPGAQSSLQDWPGRLGYWAVGVPPSGPMDDRSHRLVNRILGNSERAATLECTLTGPTLKFLCDAEIALGGAEMAALLDGVSVPYWKRHSVKAGQVLSLGRIAGAGMRTYLGVGGGFDAPLYLGSRATFSLGGFGGHATGVLKAGDSLAIAADSAGPGEDIGDPPNFSHAWDIGVLYGPHGAPNFFTREDIETLFTSEYEVHFNSARTGVRLIGPAPKWARTDGGEAGLHPSNIHDNAYAIGAIDFTGDMPIILGPDGPSLGGFVCPAALAQGELWKMGQLKPGDKVCFYAVDLEEAAALKRGAPLPLIKHMPDSDVLRVMEEKERVVYRRAGDDNILVEYGDLKLDFKLRLHVYLLMQALEASGLKGIIDLTPGIRSLQVHYDNDAISESKLLDTLADLERALPDPALVTVKSRTVHLPLSWNDEQAQLAMRKYQELVRPNAPWCPSNIEFIRRINGLESIEDVKRIVFDARYLVLGLGDVYLGAPVATPLDPRHRLVTTKYNPARTWTPENAVGIGGAYLCVYGMEGPGGYQLFGRTIQMWNTWRVTEDFEPGKPWLLRFFDQICFFPVSGEELIEARAAFPHGGYKLKIENGAFNLAQHEQFLSANAASIGAFESKRQAGFEAERQSWRELGLDTFVVDEGVAEEDSHETFPDGISPVYAPATSIIWKIEVEPGARVKAGDTLMIVESMKMEIPIPAPVSGVVRELRCVPGRMVKPGQVLALIGETA